MWAAGDDSLRWLLFLACGLQVMDYRVMEDYVLDDEERHISSESRQLPAMTFQVIKYAGIAANLMVMSCAALKLNELMAYVLPLYIGVSLCNVAELDARAGLVVAHGGPTELSPAAFATFILIPTCLRLFTTWLVYEYWCLIDAA